MPARPVLNRYRRRGPGLLAFGGNGVRPGPAVRSPIRAPSSDGETGNAAVRNSFQRLFEVDGAGLASRYFRCRSRCSAAARSRSRRSSAACNGDLRLGDHARGG